MADSDDDYDRRRREKFRRERSDYDRRPKEREDARPMPGRREDWSDKRRDTPEWRSAPKDTWDSRRRDYSRETDKKRDVARGNSPIAKRARRDWDSPQDEVSMGRGSSQWGSNQSSPAPQFPPMGPDQRGYTNDGIDAAQSPRMLSFKEFLVVQEDTIDDTVAVQRYSDYKREFRKAQVNDFFVLHREQEWLRLKYHPTDSFRRQQETTHSVKKRLRAFLDLYEDGWVTDLILDKTHSGQLGRFLDAVVTVLEGGSPEDLSSLDLEAESLPGEPTKSAKTGSVSQDTPKPKMVAKKEKYSSEEASDSSSNSDSESDDSGSSDSDGSSSQSSSASSVSSKPGNLEGLAKEVHKNSSSKTPTKKSPVVPKRHLHKTLSLFLRHVPPVISKQNIEAVCKKLPGFMRVAMSEASADRRFARRCWITFEPRVNIKEVCWSLNSVKVKDCELNAVLNRDISSRIRPVEGASHSKKALRFDLELIKKLILCLDEKSGVYKPFPVLSKPAASASNMEESGGSQVGDSQDAPTKGEDSVKVFQEINLPDSNPFIKLLSSGDRISSEMEGGRQTGEETDNDTIACAPRSMFKTLDLLLLYLRVVHSVDYYNGTEYPHEDEMPNRCGILHVRGEQPESLSKEQVEEWTITLQNRLAPLTVLEKNTISETEAVELGKKDLQEEVEKFIRANSQEISKDKWLCPLSGKKFRGAEFVRKHIFNKHNDKVEAVKVEVDYFNNYIYDFDRPSFPKLPPPMQQQQKPMPSHIQVFTRGSMMGPRAALSPQYGFGMMSPEMVMRGMHAFSPRQRGIRARFQRDPRPLVQYRDLDAPDETADMF